MSLPSPITGVAVLLCALACGCGPAGNPEDALEPVVTPAPVEPAPVEPGDSVAYRCANGGALQASYGANDVTLSWPDGRSVRLPRAESASTDGGDAYVGEQVSLQRDGDAIELHDGERAATRCEATVATTDAVARFNCDPGTEVTLDADGGGRVVLPDGQIVDLSRIAGSGPTVYTGASLYLRVEGDGAWLSQGDGSNELACTLA